MLDIKQSQQVIRLGVHSLTAGIPRLINVGEAFSLRDSHMQHSRADGPLRDGGLQRQHEPDSRVDISQSLSRDTADAGDERRLIDSNELRDVDDRIAR